MIVPAYNTQTALGLIHVPPVMTLGKAAKSVARRNVRTPGGMRGLNDGVLDVVGGWAQSAQDLFQNAYHGVITSGQGADIAQADCDSLYSQPGWTQKYSPAQLATMKQQCYADRLKIIGAVVKPYGGFADKQGWLPTIPDVTKPWLIGGAILGGLVVLWLVLK